MRYAILCLAVCALITGCNRNLDDQQRAMKNATDTRPRGGSLEGAGGAGPGYDGSGKGGGKEGTVPAPGSGVGAGQYNSIGGTNAGDTNATPAPPQSR